MGTIVKDFAKRNIEEKYKDQDPFWDDEKNKIQYSLLNNVEIPNKQIIRTYQIEKIKKFEKQAQKDRYKLFNNTIIKNEFEKALNLYNDDEILENFITKMNSFYFFDRKSETKSEKEWKQIQTRLENAVKALKILQSELKINDNILVSENTLSKLNEAIEACKNYKIEDINNFLKFINNIKGNALEEIGVDMIRKAGLPNITSIQLGNVRLNTKRSDRHSGQLIQDIMAYDKYSLSDDIIIKYRIGKDKKDDIKEVSLSDFFSLVEKMNGKSQQIIIDDESYDLILGLRQISFQAKSGKKQLAWNKNKSTQIAINDYKKDNLTLSVKKTFQLLTSLNLQEKNNRPFKLKDSSNDYNMLANYGLATVLNKVLHLSEQGNQYLLTPKGFQNYSSRIAELLKDEKYIVLLQDKIKLDQNTMSYKHDIDITK